MQKEMHVLHLRLPSLPLVQEDQDQVALGLPVKK